MNNSLWTNVEVENATNALTTGVIWNAEGICIDSRKVQPRDIFVAFKGNRVDGHSYVLDAFKKGAVAAIVEREIEGLKEENPLLIVENVQEALAQLACSARNRSAADVIAITGSVGKTSSKNLLAKALSQFDSVHSTIGNLNNHIGAPLTLARLNVSSRFAVFELGMNHSGEIELLSKLIRPKVAMITNVHGVHLEQLKTERAVAEAKGEIFQGLTEGGSVVLNQDNAWTEFLKSDAKKRDIQKIITFGEDIKSDLQLVEWQPRKEKSLVTIKHDRKTYKYVLSENGKHRALNSVGVLACVHALGLDIERAAESFKEIATPIGRGGQSNISLPNGGAFCLIDESYNASPVAMKAALSALKTMKPDAGGRRLIVIGDMLELGKNASKLHTEMLEDLLAVKPDIVFTVGRLMWELRQLLPHEICGGHGQKSSDIANEVAGEIRAGDLVLVKGSLGTDMASIINAIHALNSRGSDASKPRKGE